jgi:hypothetical protein
MPGLKAVVLSSALLAIATTVPMAAPRAGTPAPHAGKSVDPATVTKVGVALGQVSEIRQNYLSRIAAAATESEKQGLRQRSNNETKKALADQGLSVEQYNQVMLEAQANPDIEQRLIEAAKGAK